MFGWLKKKMAEMLPDTNVFGQYLYVSIVVKHMDSICEFSIAFSGFFANTNVGSELVIHSANICQRVTQLIFISIQIAKLVKFS